MARLRLRPLPLVALLLAALFASPLIYLSVRTVSSPSVGGALSGPLTRSLLLATAVAIASCVLGVSAALCTARTTLWGASVWRVLVILPLVIPSYVGASAWRALFAPGGLVGDGAVSANGFAGAFMVLTLLSYPLVTLPVAARLRSLPPSLEESARSLGAAPGRVLRTITWPQVAPVALGGALLVFLYALSDFGAVALLRYDTLTQSIYSTRLSDPDRSATLSVILALFALAVVVGQELWTRRRHLAPGVPYRGSKRSLGRATVPALGFLITLVAFALVAPLTTLSWWAFRNGDADVADLAMPAWSSIYSSVLAATLVMTLVVPIAYLVQRRRSAVGGVASAMVSVGFAVPGIVVALSLVFLSVQIPEWTGLYQSLFVLLLAYAVHFGAQGLSAARGAVASVSPRLPEAAALSGAGPLKRLRSVHLPLMMPGLLAGAGLVILSTMKELPATLLLSPVGFETLASGIWNANEDGFLAQVGLQSIVLVAVSAVLSWVLILRRMDRVT